MAKNITLDKFKEELEHDFDFSEDMEIPGDEAIAGMMNDMIETSNHQQTVALELTKLIVEKITTENLNEEKIFSVYQRATKVVAESFPLQEIWEKFN
jgi:hypothetical protein